ncbi:MAG: hypothetical protein ACM3XN_04885 [Chloroflexota bacterium]
MRARLSVSEAVDEIIAYVERYKHAPATRRVCALILGDAQTSTVSDDALRELKAYLPRTSPRLLQTCYNIVKG